MSSKLAKWVSSVKPRLAPLFNQSGHTRHAARILDVLFIVALIFAGIRFLSHVEGTMDLRPADETVYLQKGRDLFETGFVPPSFGPVYQIWYFLLSLVAPDPVDLYYLNYQVLLVGFMVSFYFALRRYGVPSWIAFFPPLYFLYSRIPYIWPYQALFSANLILLAMGIAASFRKPLHWLTVLLGGTLLAAYVRPELAVAWLALFGIALLLLGWRLIKKRPIPGSEWKPLAVVGATAAIFVLTLGSPIFNSGKERMFAAFSQHYSLNVVEDSGEEINPWIHAEKIRSRDFPTANSIGQCVSENPSAFFWHIRENVRKSLQELGRLSKANKGFFDFPEVFGYKSATISSIVLLFGLAFFFTSKRVDQVHWHPPALMLIALLLAVIPSVILVYPRQHYFICLWGVILLLPFLLFAHRELRPVSLAKRRNWIGAPLAIGLCSFPFLLPFREHGVLEKWEPDLVMAKTIRYIRDLELAGEVNLLRSEAELEEYLGPNFEGFEPWGMDEGETFDEFMRENEINVVLKDTFLPTLSNLKDDPEFQAFLKNPENSGYVPMAIPYTDRSIFVEASLWQRSRAQ